MQKQRTFVMKVGIAFRLSCLFNNRALLYSFSPWNVLMFPRQTILP